MLAGLDVIGQIEAIGSPRQGVVFSEADRRPDSSLKRPFSARIAIKVKKEILFVDPADVAAVEARGNYVVVHHKSSSYILRESISTVTEKLKAFGFVRIHRSLIVNSAFAEHLQPLATGEYKLRVRGGKEYIVSRTYKSNLQSLACSWIGSSAPCGT